MIDFCCVYACGRNSRVNEDLTYYSLPQGKERRELWLLAAGRDDLLDEAQSSSIKFCSLHFPAAQVGKDLIPKAIPSLYLPGFVTYDDHNLEAEKHNVICNSCSNDIVGFRYRCIICPDFDLCQKCEMLEVHPNHLVIRISRSNKFTQADNIITKWRDQLKAEGTKEANDNDNDYQNENAYNTIICKRGERLIKTVKKRIAQKDACRKRFTEIKKTSKKIKSEDCNNIEETSVNQYLKSQVQDLAVTHNGDIKLDKIIKGETISPSRYLQNPDLNLKGQETACDVVDNMLEIIIKREPCDS